MQVKQVYLKQILPHRELDPAQSLASFSAPESILIAVFLYKQLLLLL